MIMWGLDSGSEMDQCVAIWSEVKHPIKALSEYWYLRAGAAVCFWHLQLKMKMKELSQCIQCEIVPN